MIVEMGCRSASINKDLEEIAEAIREAITRSRAIVAVVESRIANTNGSNPEMIITSAMAREPLTPPKPCDRDFPYPARISRKLEYTRVDATEDPSHTPPRNPLRTSALARSISSRTLD